MGKLTPLIDMEMRWRDGWRHRHMQRGLGGVSSARLHSLPYSTSTYIHPAAYSLLTMPERGTSTSISTGPLNDMMAMTMIEDKALIYEGTLIQVPWIRWQ